MENIDISVIIPVKNMEKYIGKCIDSILLQKEKIEIIVVDFGSIDNTVNIVNKYNDSRINLQQIQLDNVAKARNVGMNLAKGKFLSFIDADDWICENYYSSIINKMEEEKADIGITEYTNVDEKNNQTYRKVYDKYFNKNIKCDTTFFKDVGRGEINCECWNKVYRKNPIKESNIIFNDIYGVNGEDLLFNYEIYLTNPKIVFIKNVQYFHLLREKSLGKTDAIYVGKRFNYLITRILKIAEKNDIDIEILELYISLLFQSIINKKTYKSKKIEYRSLINNEILKKVKLIEILKSNISNKRKIASVILKMRMEKIFILLTYL